MNPLVLMGAMGIAAFLGAVGQIALKKFSDSMQMTFAGVALNKWIYVFAVCYGLGVIINIGVYKLGAKVSWVYPVISLSYVFTAILAWWWLGETVSGWTMAGIGTVMIGVGLIGYGMAAGI